MQVNIDQREQIIVTQTKSGFEIGETKMNSGSDSYCCTFHDGQH